VGGVGSGGCDSLPAVAGGVGGEEIDVSSDDGLLSAVNAAGESYSSLGVGRRGLLESAAGENYWKAENYRGECIA